MTDRTAPPALRTLTEINLTMRQIGSPFTLGSIQRPRSTMTCSVRSRRRTPAAARQAQGGAGHARPRHAAALSAAADDLFRLWGAWARRHRRELLGQGSSDLQPGRAGLARRLAHPALDHQDGVRRSSSTRCRSSARSGAPMCSSAQPGRRRADPACRRRRRLDRLRRPERALCRRPASHRDRRRCSRTWSPTP